MFYTMCYIKEHLTKEHFMFMLTKNHLITKTNKEIQTLALLPSLVTTVIKNQIMIYMCDFF